MQVNNIIIIIIILLQIWGPAHSHHREQLLHLADQTGTRGTLQNIFRIYVVIQQVHRRTTVEDTTDALQNIFRKYSLQVHCKTSLGDTTGSLQNICRRSNRYTVEHLNEIQQVNCRTSVGDTTGTLQNICRRYSSVSFMNIGNHEVHTVHCRHFFVFCRYTG